MEWFTEFWASLTATRVLLGVGMFLLSFVLSAVAVGVVVVKLPANYFSTHYVQDFMPGKPWIVRWGAVIVKNLLGVLLILVGIVLSLPGIPGQGILTILLGLIMLDLPGKRPFEAKIIRRPAVRSTVDKLRARYSKPPFELD